MKVLITGFEPFGEDNINSSWEAVRLLPDHIGKTYITKIMLPVTFYTASRILTEKMSEMRPDVVICIGQAGGISQIKLERVAINLNDCTMADNDGNIPHDEAIDCCGYAAYFSTLPVRKMTEYLNTMGIPVTISNTAGTYVCNHVMYSALNFAEKKGLPTKCGFIHVPYIPEQTIDKPNVPSLSLDDLVKSLKAIIEFF